MTGILASSRWKRSCLRRVRDDLVLPEIILYLLAYASLQQARAENGVASS